MPFAAWKTPVPSLPNATPDLPITPHQQQGPGFYPRPYYFRLFLF